MSEFKDLSSALRPGMIKRMAKDKGVDIDHLPTKEELEKQTIEKARQSIKATHNKFYFNQSVWGGRPLHFTFEQWKPALQKDEKTAREIGKQAFVLAKKLQTDVFNVLLIGSKGTGKTSLGLAILDELSKAGKSIMFVSTAELSDLISKQYDYSDVKPQLEKIERAKREVDVLLLDDFGTEGGMKVDNVVRPVRKDMQDLMYRVANVRIDFDKNKVEKPTIITTNNLQEDIDRMYNQKAVSRLYPKSKEHRITFNKMGDVRNVD